MKTNKKNTKTQATANAATVSAPAAEPQKLLPQTAATTAAEPAPAPVPVADPTANDPVQPVAVIALSLIDINPRNPRQTSDQTAIEELAQNIRTMGLISPITVREVNGRFMIVCGERRYKAHLLLGRSHINAYVSDIDEAKAYDLSVSENLHREDIAPMDAAAAYKYLIKDKGMTVEGIALHYNKSVQSVYRILKLNDLVPDFADLVRSGELAVPSGIVIAKYDKKQQQEVFDKHFKPGGWHSWLEYTAAAIEKNIQSHYTNKLEDYHFDKTKCQTCAHNSQTYDLFPADGGKCARCSNKECLEKMNAAHLVAEAKALAAATPGVAFVGDKNSGSSMSKADKALLNDGYEFKNVHLYNMHSYPSKPAEPKEADFKKTDEYQKAQGQYLAKMDKYNGEVEKLDALREAGRIRVFADIRGSEITMHYKDVNNKDTKTPEQLIAEMTDRKKDNEKKAHEKTVDGLKKMIGEHAPATDFTALEEKMLYFFLLNHLAYDHDKFRSAAGLKKDDYCRSGERWAQRKVEIVASLTEAQKTAIRRAFLHSALEKVRPASPIDSKMLMDYCKLHDPETSGVIHADFMAECEKRNERLDENIAAQKKLIEKTKKAAKAEKQDEAAAPAEPTKTTSKAKPAPKGKAVKAQAAAV